jgi:hypothetical protein
VARLRDRFRRNRDRRVRRFEMCVDCGSTVCVLPPKPRPVGGVDPFGAGWVAL